MRKKCLTFRRKALIAKPYMAIFVAKQWTSNNVQSLQYNLEAMIWQLKKLCVRGEAAGSLLGVELSQSPKLVA